MLTVHAQLGAVSCVAASCVDQGEIDVLVACQVVAYHRHMAISPCILPLTPHRIGSWPLPHALPFFIAAIRAFRSSLRRAISASFSSLLIPAKLFAAGAGAADVPADEAEGAGEAADERGMEAASATFAAGAGAVDAVEGLSIEAAGIAGANEGFGAVALGAPLGLAAVNVD